MKKRRQVPLSLILLPLVGVLFLLSLLAISVGSSRLNIQGSFQIIAERLQFFNQWVPRAEWGDQYRTIVFQLRLPRILLSILAGAGLSVVGAVFQSIFRNPLAEPHILGVSSGAAFGVTLAVITGFKPSGVAGLGSIGFMAFLGALITVTLVYFIAGGDSGQNAPISMLLVGAAMGTLLSSLISLLMLFHHDEIARVYMWTLGSFSAANWDKVRFLLILSLPCLTYLLTQGRSLNLLLSGEEEALSMGLDTAAVRKRLIVVSSLLVAGIVAVSGIVGFVGLIIPQFVRMLRQHDLRRLLPISLLLGASFVLLCDTAARTMLAPVEIPVGIITSIFGVPYFLSGLILQRRRGRF